MTTEPEPSSNTESTANGGGTTPRRGLKKAGFWPETAVPRSRDCYLWLHSSGPDRCPIVLHQVLHEMIEGFLLIESSRPMRPAAGKSLP